MTIKIIAAMFAAYECYKLLNNKSFKELIEHTKRAGRQNEAPQIMEIMSSPFFQRVMLIEFAYIIFALVLLFTAYWYFTIVLFGFSIAMVFLDTSGQKGDLIIGIGSAVSAILLMYIVMA